MAETKLAPPWVTYHRKLTKFFEYDEGVVVGALNQDKDGYTINILTDSAEKALALIKTLSLEKDFGGVKVSLYITTDTMHDICDVVEAAFSGNELFAKLEKAELIPGSGLEMAYAVLRPEVLQFRNDNASDYKGNTTMLAADVACDIFDLGGACFLCTEDLEENRE